jgi:hypothetical protein
MQIIPGSGIQGFQSSINSTDIQNNTETYDCKTAYLADSSNAIVAGL